MWKDIVGYEGLYQISNLGNVRSLNYKNTKECKNLVKKINNKGYEYVTLSKQKEYKPFLVHRLVATAFIQKVDGFTIVNHKDENPLNNSADNLEWCNHKYNSDYYFSRHGEEFSNTIRIKKTGRIIKNNKKVAQKSLKGETIRIFDNSVMVEKELGYYRSSIVACCKKKRKTAHGYKWEFVE